MAGLWQRLRDSWQEFCKRRTYGRRIHPDTLGQQALELAMLAELALQSVAAPHPAECQQLASLVTTMRQLADTARMPEFYRLPAERRWALYRQMQAAREKLIASLQKSQMPTEKPQ